MLEVTLFYAALSLAVIAVTLLRPAGARVRLARSIHTICATIKAVQATGSLYGADKIEGDFVETLLKALQPTKQLFDIAGKMFKDF